MRFFFWVGLLTILPVLFTLGLIARAFALFRRDDEDLIREIEEPAALVAKAEIDEDDDSIRRWLFDFSAFERIQMVHGHFEKQSMDVVNEVPFEDWVAERRAKRRLQALQELAQRLE